MTGHLVHATCIAFVPEDGPAGSGWERPFGVLLRGPSGAGKSDLALRSIDRGWRLVADDQTELRPAGGRLSAASPGAIAGRMEVRGLGIVSVPSTPGATLCLVVDLVSPGLVERLPEPDFRKLLGVRLRRLALDPFEVSALAKLRLAAFRESGAIMAAIQPGGKGG
ncbi:MAG: HPr kinase/phosphatase C-terminal domain-containing protein [Rhodospirillales bacterium]|nr:HPr kinase/phosphatase C-terminal domain-containing protein [Rhodospirillales bacterium]MDH3913092.1 HPr kinase/phosphatase C-terminal domain-containing protein [Rhodospirillales bacterium]MDH3916727.1 HPr kinase/phosphatase C-terminal domain-containing protein [Rhodospirillales bacterium]MDH3969489.1 HPr kinase/phosphatase C-terminal domain-containing protein [Rhodospirillales bacterium]